MACSPSPTKGPPSDRSLLAQAYVAQERVAGGFR